MLILYTNIKSYLPDKDTLFRQEEGKSCSPFLPFDSGSGSLCLPQIENELREDVKIKSGYKTDVKLS